MNTNAYTHQRGYTLLELLTALTVLLILTTLALPSFSNIVRRTQSDTQVYALVNAAQLARSSAVMRQQSVVFCASADQRTCGNDWTEGAMVFADPNDNRTVDNDEPVLAVLPPPPEGSTLVMKAALNKQYLRYMDNGMLENTAGSFIYCPAHATEREARNVIFNRTGRMRLGYDRNRDGIPENAEGQPVRCPL
ncbi:MAG TPA: GspH/FimT family protein [Pseudomonadales bacterium]|nr:GspH/FimT family protein [Pseudomonadales bacterium]HNI37408.1 GspH/FimT family protein [Pseudomonadales bacterium]HNN86840.1 GspH/FimT family protein [Pseudomonadales bacterium]